MQLTANAPFEVYRWELFLNQLWQGLNFLSKAAFLALLTPLMLQVWGADQYGLFALSSSLLVSLAILDCGVRSLTRLRLCQALAEKDIRDFHFALCEGLAAFGLVSLFAFVVAVALALAHLWSLWFHLPPEGDFLIAMTVGLVGLFMLSTLLLESFAAEGRISALKKVNTVGALAAIPLVGLLVWLHGSVTLATLIYFLCLTLPNIILFLTRGPIGFWREAGRLSWTQIGSTIHSGGWFYVTTLALVAKTHALTFLVSAFSGPAAAGIFYILLRITEMVGGLGATSSDTSLASLAQEKDPKRRAENFQHGYFYALVFCLHGTLVIGFLTPFLLTHWLPHQVPTLSSFCAWAMAAYGLSAAFSKVVVNAAMGTRLVRTAAIGNLLEAILVLLSGVVLQPFFGLTGLFLGATVAALALLPTVSALSRNFQESILATWIFPLRSHLGPLLCSGLVLAGAWYSQRMIAAVIAGAITSGLVLWSLRKLHSSGK